MSGRMVLAGAVLALVGALVSALGLVLAFTMAPLVLGADVTPELVGDQMVSNQLLFSQKIFYWHVPVALTSFIALVFTAVCSIAYLRIRDSKWDLRARTSTEVALVFIICTMGTGVPWTRFEWGVWWTWDPRLTTYLILMLLCIGYFVLRAALAGKEQQATFSAIFGIILFIDAPICFAVTRLIPSSLHPVVFRTDSGLTPDMLLPFLVSMLGMLLVGLGLYFMRLHQVSEAQRIESLKARYEELELMN